MVYKVMLGETVFDCKEHQTLLEAANQNKVAIPVGCRGGGCGMCKVRIVEGNYNLGLCSTRVLPYQQRKEGYVLSCKTYPRSEIRIALTQSSFVPSKHREILLNRALPQKDFPLSN